ncbi:radial spoke head 14 homolog isoform X4 [Scyliorhinus torazame]|uniref:radial spoke head 14 homolog isoform X4 n=1 Tax=Scyliorhinus torazame TaxID=75743 RepID=UPI003B5CCFD6
MNESIENTSTANNLQENDILEKLMPDEKHQELNDTLDHPEGSDITKLNNGSDHPQEPEIMKCSKTSDNTKDTDTKKFENESNNPEGTDPEHTKCNYGTPDCTQKYSSETEGHLNSTVQCNGKIHVPNVLIGAPW